MKTRRGRDIQFGKLLLAILLAQLAGVIGSVATFLSVGGWYQTLVKPAFSPPNWLFGPVWIFLYTLMGTSLYLVWKNGLAKKRVREAFWLFIAHLVVNAGWSIVFFGLHQILVALFVIFGLWVLIIALIKLFYPIQRLAAYLLVPYFLWVSFATVLNTALFLLNR